MPTNELPTVADTAVPDYDLAPHVVADRPDQLKALADPTRVTILGLLAERAASTTQLATAMDKPKGTIGYHLKVLEGAGLVRVVRTRKVRAMTEKYYGRVARTIVYGAPRGTSDPFQFVREAMREAAPPQGDLPVWTIRRARIPAERAEDFARRVIELAEEFAAQPRDGDRVYGLLAGVYPTTLPVLPPDEGGRR